MSALGCGSCGAIHQDLAPGSRCPACGAGGGTAAEPRHPASPERAIRRAIDLSEAQQRLAAYVAPVWFPVDELDPALLASRLVRVWWPAWLVDVDAAGIWEADAGFDYPVESSQEVYDGGRWTTREVTETRTRWERRTGRLRRRYDNLAVPALGAPPHPMDPSLSEPWQPEVVDGPIRLPDRSPDEQWPLVLEALRQRVGEECGKACGADHVRELFLDIDASGAHWSLLLGPGYTTWYADDEGRTVILTIDGATGEIRGPRLSSEARGRKQATIWFAVGGSLLLLGLILGVVALVLWFLIPIAGALLAAGILVGTAGLWPLLQPARWNRGQRQPAQAG